MNRPLIAPVRLFGRIAPRGPALAAAILLASAPTLAGAQSASNDQSVSSPQSATDVDTALVRLVARRTAALVRDDRVPAQAMNRWDWEAGVAIAGLMHAYEATGDETILRDVAEWTETRWAAGVTLTHANHATPAWGVLMLYEHRPDPRYMALVERSVQFLMNRAPRVHGALAHYDDQLWDDTLIVSVPLLARYGARHGCPACLDQAVDEVLAHARRLQDPASGIVFHGWDASNFRTGRNAHMSAAFWARGNGWVALATAELLRFLPPDHPGRPEVLRVLGRQLFGLARLQHPSGRWHTVVNRQDFYLESSGSAAIAATMIRAAGAGWVEEGFAGSGARGYGGVRAKIAPDGTLTEVSTGTGVAPSFDDYSRIPFDPINPYGQGLCLLMLTAEASR